LVNALSSDVKLLWESAGVGALEACVAVSPLWLKPWSFEKQG
jgi:hypothetical protein